MRRATAVSIAGNRFLINGEPTYAGRKRVEGLLLNARMVQGLFDDLNPQTRERWTYPDGPWDARRNTAEFVAAMPAWRASGLVCFTLNLQGGSPEGYSREQPWHNSAFRSDGTLRADYLERLDMILQRADELGMVVILGLFYFGQDRRLADETAVITAVDQAIDWLLANDWRNVLVEVANEADVGRYHHGILQADRCHELIRRVRERSGGVLPASTSLRGGSIPGGAIVRESDFLLLHGNRVGGPDDVRRMVRECRSAAAYRGQPILFNEDDHFDFDQNDNHFLAAVGEYAGWGYFDYRFPGEGHDEGFQSVPVNWRPDSGRKRGFFRLLAQLTGHD